MALRSAGASLAALARLAARSHATTALAASQTLQHSIRRHDAHQQWLPSDPPTAHGCHRFSSGASSTSSSNNKKFRLTPTIESRLEKAQQRYAELNSSIMDLSSGQGSSGSQLQQAMKEQSMLQPLADNFAVFKQTRKELHEAQALMRGDEDPELRQLASEEVGRLGTALQEVEQALLLGLLPREDEEQSGAIVEVRGGTGGEEAALFAAELLAMYQRYAEGRGWGFQVLEWSGTDEGGCRFASAGLSGEGAYGRLRFEAGVHRVQRVPSTETQGRIHTSTASVVVLPEAQEVSLVIREEDLKLETMRASGAGGQHVNVTDSAVRITHLPSGIVVSCQQERSQIKNKALAMKVLRARLAAEERRRKEASLSKERRAAIGTGDRNERIRTYNFPQDRVTEHRVGLTLHGITAMMGGEPGGPLDCIMDALHQDWQARQLGELMTAEQQ